MERKEGLNTQVLDIPGLYHLRALCVQLFTAQGVLIFSSFFFGHFFLHSVLLCISFRCTAQWSHNHTSQSAHPQYFQYPPGGAIHSDYSIINYIPYAVLYKGFLIFINVTNIY